MNKGRGFVQKLSWTFYQDNKKQNYCDHSQKTTPMNTNSINTNGSYFTVCGMILNNCVPLPLPQSRIYALGFIPRVGVNNDCKNDVHKIMI